MNNEQFKKQNKRIPVHIPLIAYAMLIFILSSIPSLNPPDMGIDAEDKIAHCIEYAVLGVLIMRSVAAVRNPITPGLLWMSWALGAFYGVTDEIHQYFVPNRFASPWDALADTVGVAIGALGYAFFYKRRISNIQHASSNDETKK
jgi:VanZ family protein